MISEPTCEGIARGPVSRLDGREDDADRENREPAVARELAEPVGEVAFPPTGAAA